ncbi:hypothetical protein FA15DRAFT_688005 [Coprinopsis marcescibilis]|uniref:Microbial-type PARG catalytic domain-containing protein n=1 Tax=Coprinopsis marcescibilis TaxID=230819 RepID=A0A5C3KSN8_COPMA|nr:hypothetical protein FA15DRAFT_688005 [Coprinopsis marcescibilis]
MSRTGGEEDKRSNYHGQKEEHSSQGATRDSAFIPEQLPALDPAKCPNAPQSNVEVVNSASFTAARKLINQVPDAKGKMSVLNLASDEDRAGGWIYTLSKTQEEALCYSSTLYETLKLSYYPWSNVGPGSVAGVFSPGVVIFKDDLDHGCRDLASEEREVVSVITVAAPRGPTLTKDRQSFRVPSVLEDLRGKIRLVYRMAAHNGQSYMILGAMGCGAYRCPSRLVAEQMKEILLEPEFKGWFHRVVFAVYSHPSTYETNFDVFSEVFRDTTIGDSPA